jgi:hypothetical protein
VIAIGAQVLVEDRHLVADADDRVFGVHLGKVFIAAMKPQPFGEFVRHIAAEQFPKAQQPRHGIAAFKLGGQAGHALVRVVVA